MILSSISIYYLQYRIFHQEANTIFYLFQDLAFVPLQVLLVTLVWNRFLNIIEARKKVKKIHVIISTFFVEAGTEILAEMTKFQTNKRQLYDLLKEDSKKRKEKRMLVDEFSFTFDMNQTKLMELSKVLNQYRSFMLNMLGNDNLLEHDSFTDTLWAIFHMADELKMRYQDTKNLQEGFLDKDDFVHLTVDLKRAYIALLHEWANYMEYLEKEYPFLYAFSNDRAKKIFLS